MLTPEIKEDFPVCTCTGRLLGCQEGGAPSHNKCGHVPNAVGEICLRKKLHMHLGVAPRTSQVWRQKQVNWPYVNKDPEGLSLKVM